MLLKQLFVPNVRRLSMSIDSLPKIETKNISVGGWVYHVTKRGNLAFLKVGDGRTNQMIQIVASRELADNVQVGSSIKAVGKWKRSEGKGQEMELEAEHFQCLGNDKNPRYNISPDNLRKTLHLRARSTEFAALIRARSRIFQHTHQFFMNEEFVHIETPKLTMNDSEGGGEVFDVSTTTENGNKEEEMKLTVSSQLHLEAMASRLSKVYTLGPAFRAEKQQSRTHMSEFQMLEAEVSFENTVDEMCDLVQKYVSSMIQLTFNDPKLSKDLESMGTYCDQTTRIPKNQNEWPRITYDTAVKLLETNGQKVVAKSGLSRQNELWLVDKHDRSPLFVTHFPSSQKPFYMARTEDGLNTESFDLLVPHIGELAGGSVRENDVEKLKERGCNIEWYLDLRMRGQAPSAGFGIGFDRLIQMLLGVKNIKDTVSFPRWYNHCQC